MRLLVVSKSFPPLRTAQALQIGKVTEAISNCDCKTIVLAGVPSDDKSSLGSSTNSSRHVRYVPYTIPWIGKHRLTRIWARICLEVSPINRLFGWVTRASDAAMEILSDRKIDIIMTSSSPFESHLVGLELKRKTGLPWIASFSDPWPISFAPVPYYTRGLPVIREVSRFLARKVMHECDAIHMPSRYGVEWTEKISGVPITDKSVTIPHIGSRASNAEMASDYVGWLAHVGDLSRERVSQELLAGIKKAHQEIPNRFKGLLCAGNEAFAVGNGAFPVEDKALPRGNA